MDFERQIVLDILEGSSLVILGRGLGVHRCMLNLLMLHCEPAGLVVVLNAYPTEEYYFIEMLQRDHVTLVPRSVTSEFLAKDREALYLKGGVLFVSSQILVMDILRKCCPTDKISGIIVYHADKITEQTMDAFILRLFRERNKTGFIHGLSDCSDSFVGELYKVDHVMKCLFARHLHLWPRFHAAVKDVLDAVKPDVREIHVRLSVRMEQIQFSLIDLIKLTLEELRKKVPISSFDKSQLTVESCLLHNFAQSIRLQLDSVWAQIGQKAKSLIEDLSTLRRLLFSLLQHDCVTFWSLLSQIKNEVDTTALHQVCKHEWLFMQPADTLISAARERVYGRGEGSEKSPHFPRDIGPDSELELESNPKCAVLADIISECENNGAERSDTGPILVVVDDTQTSSYLEYYLDGEGRDRLLELCHQLANSCSEGEEQNRPRFFNSRKHYVPPEKRPKLSRPVKTLEQCFPQTDTTEDLDLCPSPSPVRVKFVTQHKLLYPHQAAQLLEETRPHTVVLYHPDLSWVRHLECYQAIHTDLPLTVHFMMYKDSIEEQRFLSSLRREKESFECLVRQKSLMVIPEDREGKDASCSYLSRDPTGPISDMFTHICGGRVDRKERKIIIDVREFKSILPALIHKRGIDIEPVTLEVGDYILSPDMCVERKAVADLIQSLTSGRLYNQCTAMCRYYSKPILLIEAREGEHLCLDKNIQGVSQDVAGRLVLLTLHFPKLRITWCENAVMAAELFDLLKKQQPEPNIQTALGIGSDLDLFAGDKHLGGTGVEDFLLKLPGVSYRNHRSLLRELESLAHLSSLSEQRMRSIIGEEDGRTLWSFLHRDFKQKSVEGTGQTTLSLQTDVNS